MFRSILNLFYPKTCLACESITSDNEQLICSTCKENMAETYFHTYTNNPIEKIFYGRIEINRAAALFFFEKDGLVQNLIHQLKYKGQKKVGHELGLIYAHKLIDSNTFPTPDIIVPVPLHQKKLLERGYNQSLWFGKGLSEGLNIPINDTVLFRHTKSDSQTKKGRYKRWENVKGIFAVQNLQLLEGKHLLLVDDTITTGSTLEACIKALKTIPDIQVSVLTIAYAK